MRKRRENAKDKWGQAHTQVSPCGLGFLATWRLGPQARVGRVSQAETISPFNLVSGDMEGHDPHIVITGMDSLRPAHITGEGDQNPPFDKKNVPRTCRLL